MKGQFLFDLPLPAGWRLLSVDDIKSPEKHSCVAGPFGSSISSKFFVEQGVPVIRGGNLRDDLTPFVTEGFVFVSKEQAQRYKGQHVQGGDLVFTCWGTLGQVGLIPKDGPFPEYIISNKQLKLRPNREIADARFLFYYFGSPQMVQHIRSIAIGAAVPGINLGLLKGLQVALPPLDIQKAIVAVLSAYDDLIENNTRRIKILEDMAQMIYREWFVNFRFPGHEKVRMVESELGPIPEGWRIGELGEIAEIQWGDTSVTKASYVSDGGFVAFSASGPDGRMEYYDFDRSGIVLSAIGANCGLTWYTSGKWSCIKNTICFWAKTHSADEFLYFATKGKEFWPKRGSAQPFVSLGDARAKRVVIPTVDITKRFSEIALTMLSLIAIQERKNSHLRTTRDFLLPKLISGEVAVEAAAELLEQTA
jgi:type I restriction enzyme S subunit